MKKIICLALAAAALTGAVSVIADAALLSPAVSVIAEDAEMIKTGLVGTDIKFTDGDFKRALGISDFKSVKIISLPSSNEGTLYLGSRRVSAGQTIKRRNIGALYFRAADSTVSECSFLFTCDSLAGGAEIPCTLKFIEEINRAPAAGNADAAISVWTQMDISYHGEMVGTDPEGDELVYMIIRYPEKGMLTVADNTSGKFVYSPSDGYTGSDSFTYVVRDEYGNYSKPQEVSVKVIKRESNVTYVDMENNPAYNAAVVMTAKKIMTGSLLGDDMYFDPDDTVTRAEFTAMALKALGISPMGSAAVTYFDDDDEIPSSLKGYVCAAQRLGVINGSFKDGELVFEPNREITRPEAASIITKLIDADIPDETYVFSDSDSIPSWAVGAVGAMYSLGIFNVTDGAIGASSDVTRADCAGMLMRIMELEDKL